MALRPEFWRVEPKKQGGFVRFLKLCFRGNVTICFRLVSFGGEFYPILCCLTKKLGLVTGKVGSPKYYFLVKREHHFLSFFFKSSGPVSK